MDTFAFIIHPIDPKRDVSRKFPFLGRVLNERQIDFFSTFFPPVYISEIEGIRSDATGKEIKGWFIACPYTPRRMMELPERAVYRKIIQTGRLAEKLGAQILGLGAFTSVVGDAGITIADALDVPVTTGNSYTVIVSVEAIRQAAAAAARGLQNTSIAAGAGEAALIDTATPIAAADASAYQRQALVNQDATNQFASQKLGLSGQERLQGKEQTFQGEQNALTRGLQERLGMADINARIRVSENALAAENARISAQMEMASKQLHQAFQIAGMEDATRRYVVDKQLSTTEKLGLMQLSSTSMGAYANGAAAIIGRIQMIVIIIALILNLAIFLIRVMPADAGSISYDWEMECIGTPIVYPLSANRSIIYCDGMDDPLGVRK